MDMCGMVKKSPIWIFGDKRMHCMLLLIVGPDIEAIGIGKSIQLSSRIDAQSPALVLMENETYNHGQGQLYNDTEPRRVSKSHSRRQRFFFPEPK